VTTVTINGHTYTDDADPTTGFANGGHRARFVPALSDVVAVAAQVASNALVASNAAASAVTGASTSASSTTSLAISTGSKSLTIETGKNIVIGMTVKIAVTADGTQWMAGDVTAYTSGTGALVVNVTTTQGSGTFAAWTVSLSGPPGAGIPSMTGNSGRFLTNNGTSANWSATIVEASGRIGIGRVAATGKLEVEDGLNGAADILLLNLNTGASAESRVVANTDAGIAWLYQKSTAGGAFGGVMTSGAGGHFSGTSNAADVYLVSNSVSRIRLAADGTIDFLTGTTWKVAGHKTRYDSGAVTPQTGLAAYSALTHGGTRRPDSVEVVGRCKVAINGVAVGQEVALANIGCDRTATHLILKQNATPVYRTSTGAVANIGATEFDLYVRAFWWPL